MFLHNLNKPITVRGVTIPARCILAPINTGFSNNDGSPDQRLSFFHEARAGNGIGIAFVGNVATSRELTTNNKTLILDGSNNLNLFTDLSKTIQGKGSLAGIQISASPKWLKPARQWRVSNIQQEIARLKFNLSSMSSEEIREQLETFFISTKLAVEAHYDVVQFHAAHGYLLSLLMNPLINQRDDIYSIKEPWLEMLCENILKDAGGALISFRVSLYSTSELPNEEFETSRKMLKRLENSGVDLIDISAGIYTLDRSMIYPKTQSHNPIYLPSAIRVASNMRSLVAVAGGFRDLAQIPELPPNMMVSIGRPLLADAQFVNKYINGEQSSIRHCMSMGRCHYFTRGLTALECGMNPNLGKEGDADA